MRVRGPFLLAFASLLHGTLACSSGSEGEGEGEGAPAPLEVTLALPQALAGSFAVNRDVYPQIAVDVDVDGPDRLAAALVAHLGDASLLVTAAEVGAFMPTGRRDRIEVALDGVAEGEHTLMVEAMDDEGNVAAHVSATLVVHGAGIQHTAYDEVGAAASPRLLSDGPGLWLSWADNRTDGHARAWLAAIDGAGRTTSAPIALIDDEEREALYAYTAMADGLVGVLWHSHGTPYRSYFRVVDLTGAIIVADVDLDPSDRMSAYGADVTFDGEAFVGVFVTQSAGIVEQEVRQVRVFADGTIVGPSIVAQAGDEDPSGRIALYAPVAVVALDGATAVSFVREHMISALGVALPRAQVAWVDGEGTVLSSAHAASVASWTSHDEGAVFPRSDKAVLVWTSNDLADDEDPPHTRICARELDATGFTAGATLTLDHLEDRTDLCFFQTEAGDALAYVDHRAYHPNPAQGHIDLYVSGLDASFVAQDPQIFPAARFVAGLAHLKTQALGRNALMVWVDERAGEGVADPKPEIWLETAWR